jgi:hypothetical protein
MPNKKMPKDAEKYICEICNFKCSKLSNYNKHLSTRKHQILINPNEKIPKEHICVCGKSYKHASSLCGHKTKCNYKKQEQQEHPPKEENTPKDDDKDKVIDVLLKQNDDMQNLVLLLVKSMQENQSNQMDSQADMTKKIIQEVMPLIGNDHHNTTTNSHNNTLNFYLTNTCKDAESITDFTSRFCERIETFFNGNYDKIAHNQISLADNVQTIFFECMDDKTQPNRFIQTTDKKNGIFYVKEQKKDEENKLVGDAEFVKYKDGFDKHGDKLGHAIHKTINPCKNACIPKLELNIQPKPNEEDYEDYDEYEKEYDNYRISTGEIKDNLMFQTHYAMNLFDNKQVREKTLSHTKRSKYDISNR